MHPGRNCFDCHQQGGFLVLAGTVYTNAHEVDDCNGASGVTVTVTDSIGNEYQSVTNAAGNFGLVGVPLVPPYTARLDYQGRVREMVGMQSSVGCNSCHTEAGAQDAPGRIMAP
jgi:hypothetical protein